MISAKQEEKSMHLRARDFIRNWPERGSRPVLLIADDDQQYIVKSLQVDCDRGRAIAIEHVAERLGTIIGAPVSQPVLIDVPHSLIEQHDEMQHMKPGTAHGTTWVGECIDARGPIDLEPLSENRRRYALIAVLFGWLVDSNMLGDMQFIYRSDHPHLVYAVDFDVFWERIPIWPDVKAVLEDPNPILGTIWSPGPAAPNSRLLRYLAGDEYVGSVPEIHDACRQLARVDENFIAEDLAELPDNWGLTLDHREALARYFETRLSDLLSWQQKMARFVDK